MAKPQRRRLSVSLSLSPSSSPSLGKQMGGTRRTTALTGILGKRKRFENATELRPDNGERFLYEYFLEQRAREKEAGWVKHVGEKREWLYCPCDKCTKRRQTCTCGVCAKSKEHQSQL